VSLVHLSNRFSTIEFFPASATFDSPSRESMEAHFKSHSATISTNRKVQQASTVSKARRSGDIHLNDDIVSPFGVMAPGVFAVMTPPETSNWRVRTGIKVA
jgi:hypothetical protein